MSLPPELAAIRDEAMNTSCEAWAIRHRWKLSPGIDRAGPCPNCGGTDRFSIHTRKNTFHCRKCPLSGAGVIDLVMQLERKEFVEACEIITGRRASDPVDEKRMQALREQNERNERKREEEAARYREKAREDGFRIWCAGAKTYAGTEVDDYLFLRLRAAGLDLPLRYAPELPYTVKRGNGSWQTIHSGPAMLAALQLPDGRFGAVHRTWVDLSKDKGKAELVHPDTGEALNAKTMRGAKQGCAIRLVTPPSARRIVMGEGIETTVTPYVHALEPDTAYWAAGDIGNMAGRAARDANNKMLHDQPDMTDLSSFLPPDWCEELIYLCEGDDPSARTEEKIIRGLRRAQAVRAAAIAGGQKLPALTIGYVPAPEGAGDLNDLVRVE